MLGEFWAIVLRKIVTLSSWNKIMLNTLKMKIGIFFNCYLIHLMTSQRGLGCWGGLLLIKRKLSKHNWRKPSRKIPFDWTDIFIYRHVMYAITLFLYGDYKNNIFCSIWSLQDGLVRRELHPGGVQQEKLDYMYV